MKDHEDQTGSYECVQPELGHQIWRLEMKDTSDELRSSLENHLAVCDSCRLTLAAEVLVKEGARDNSLKIVKTSPAKRLSVLNFNLIGSISLAASLALALLMPPGQLENSLVRGDGAPGFIRPVEGETIRQDTPELTWNAVPGATAYRVEISGVGNDYQSKHLLSLSPLSILFPKTRFCVRSYNQCPMIWFPWDPSVLPSSAKAWVSFLSTALVLPQISPNFWDFWVCCS